MGPMYDGASPRYNRGMDRRQALGQALAKYAAKTSEEARHLASMRSLLSNSQDPFRRDRYEPGHFTASAFVLCPEHRSLLLILHGKLDRWLQPGGHVDVRDRDLEAAARREVAEETGLQDLRLLGDGIFDVDVHAIPARKTEPAHAHFDVRYAFTAPRLDARPASDARDVRWVVLAEVPEIETDASVLRAVKALPRLCSVQHG